MPRDPIHLHPTAPLADRVLLPGDPGRALLLAQELLEAPKMFNHHRGLWGYTGAAKADGEPMTIQSTGMGGPSAAIMLSELISLGVTRAVRVGTALGLSSSLGVGDVVVASSVLGVDGTSAAVGGGPTFLPDAELLARLRGEASGLVVSRDVFYDASRLDEWRSAGAVAVDLESAALLAVGAASGVAVASVVGIVAVSPEDGPLGEQDAQRVSERVGRAGVAALVG